VSANSAAPGKRRNKTDYYKWAVGNYQQALAKDPTYKPALDNLKAERIR
jgi:hypothetical protein